MDVTRPREIRELLQKYGIKIRKSWGQNFLINKAAVDNILSAAKLTGEETVVEVGPGLGVMTTHLLKLAREVVAIEIDPLLCRVLNDQFPDAGNFHLVQGDALAQDFGKLVPGPYVVVANLPYYITSPFLIKLIEQQHPPQAAVVLVQWEVAKRLTALPGTSDYGSLSVFVQYHCQAELMYKVGPGNFYPPPKVDSAVVRIQWRLPVQRPNNEDLMFRIIRIAFGQRRKMLKGLLARQLGLDPISIQNALEKLGLNGNIRGEKMSVTDFAALTDILEGKV